MEDFYIFKDTENKKEIYYVQANNNIQSKRKRI